MRTGLRERARRRTQFGAAAVEFALLLPIMMGVIAGITDFGRAYFTQIELTNAAREGARAAIVGGDAAARAQAAVSDPPPDGFGSSVNPCTGPDDEAEVTVSANFDWMFLGPVMNANPWGADGVLPPVLTSTAVMACN